MGVYCSGVAIGGLHVCIVSGDLFVLCRSDWSTFVLFPLAPVEPSKLLVCGVVRLFGDAPYAPALLQQVWFYGSVW